MAGFVKGSEEQKKAERKRALMIGQTKDLRDKGLSPVEIAEKLKISESTVRSYMNVIDQAEANGMK